MADYLLCYKDREAGLAELVRRLGWIGGHEDQGWRKCSMVRTADVPIFR